ncbi:hypothetical protein B0J12DRAFT_690533, partial [Macrophomina phaseolina]
PLISRLDARLIGSLRAVEASLYFLFLELARVSVSSSRPVASGLNEFLRLSLNKVFAVGGLEALTGFVLRKRGSPTPSPHS